MKKLALLTLLAVAVSSTNSFAHDDHKAKKTADKCTKGGDCCKKGTTKAAMMKAAAKPAAKKA